MARKLFAERRFHARRRKTRRATLDTGQAVAEPTRSKYKEQERRAGAKRGAHQGGARRRPRPFDDRRSDRRDHLRQHAGGKSLRVFTPRACRHAPRHAPPRRARRRPLRERSSLFQTARARNVLPNYPTRKRSPRGAGGSPWTSNSAPFRPQAGFRSSPR